MYSYIYNYNDLSIHNFMKMDSASNRSSKSAETTPNRLQRRREREAVAFLIRLLTVCTALSTMPFD